ncbi:hypothetical protein [Jannaschia sp. M317]|uniref:hypothetical protein n=1 Tax=Jannaschia sp. M317 TaxID=2867011 RepID=UPI0021A3DE8C|nr:hypothetical protein [Jannaschia sp. M317]UWQ18694.1 hypothetical protein K3551_05245 [Jannaschia sp. M317]
MMRQLMRAVPLLATLAASGWALSTNPLAAPFVDRSASELALTLDRAVARRATPDWIAAELEQAVATGDAEQAEMLLGLADELGHDVPRDPAQALIAAEAGWMAQGTACGTCMVDIGACRSLTQIAACAVPFEMSPLGDLNALRRAGGAWAGGQQVDQLDAGLALIGLGATGAILVSGGSSGAVKAGAGLLRMARRMGSVTPDLARLMRVPVRWDVLPGYLRGTARLEDLAPPRQVAALSAVAADMDRVRGATSAPEALRLLRHVDGPEDAARLARVAEAAGPRTTRTLAVLGKGRVFRATVRLSRAAAGTLVLLWLSLVHLGLVVATRLGALTLRALTPLPPRQEPPITRR